MNQEHEKQSQRQTRPFRENDDAVIMPNGTELPVIVKQPQSYRPKNPIKDKFIETKFLADIKRLMRIIREKGVHCEKKFWCRGVYQMVR